MNNTPTLREPVDRIYARTHTNIFPINKGLNAKRVSADELTYGAQSCGTAFNFPILFVNNLLNRIFSRNNIIFLNVFIERNTDEDQYSQLNNNVLYYNDNIYIF